MMQVALSEFKAKMAHYLRLVKAGEEVQLQERGKLIASVVSTKPTEEEWLIEAQKSPKKLGKTRFSVKLSDKIIDVVEFLLEDRGRR